MLGPSFSCSETAKNHTRLPTCLAIVPSLSPPAHHTQGNILYVAVTRAKRRLILNPTLHRRLREGGGKWDSLACRGVSTDPTLGGLPATPCHGYGCECLDAHGAAATNSAAAGAVASQAPRLLFAGSGSMAPFCRACVEGVAAEEGNKGKFPYAGALLTPPPPQGTG